MGSKKGQVVPFLFSYLVFSIVIRSVRGFLGQEGCPTSSCGDLQNIRYPFRLKTDPTNCGNYELVCDANKTFLEYRSGKYYVTNISYENNTIQVVDVDLAAGNCSLPSRSISSTPDVYSRYSYALMAQEWASFVTCSNKIENYMYWPLPCLTQNGTFGYVTSGYQVSNLLPSCGFLSMVPIVDRTIISLQTDVYGLLQKGFILIWDGDQDSPSTIVHHCLGEASRMFDDLIKSNNIFSQMSSVVKSEMHFLACLEDYSTLGNRYKRTFHMAIAIMVLIEIVQLVIVLAILGRLVFAPITVFVFLAHKFWTIWASVDTVEKFLRNQQSLTPTRYAYTDIIAMTNHFKEKLGQGGFGSVFKGELPGGYLVAVKMLGNSKGNGEDFINEVSTIGQIHHLNVVRLVGFCSEGSKRALVYEHMPNGSLDKYIFSSNRTYRPFSLEKLNEIALGIARGIDYLHRGCDMRILHFDIKPYNILLDQNFNPKVSDFGLAKLYPKDYSMVSLSVARGTIGYIAPELVSRNFGVISYKSDVYSFGMLLMEMAGGRRNVDPKANSSSQTYFPSWIYDKLDQREAIEIVHDFEIKEVEKKLCIVGLWCIQMKPSDRPSMSKVVEMLEADVDDLPMPPKPFVSWSLQPDSDEKPSTDSCATELSIIVEQ